MLAFTDTRSEYEDVAGLYVPIAAAVFVLVVLALAIILIRNRARPGREPSRRMQSQKLELGYLVVLVGIVAVLVWRTFEAVSAEAPVVADAADPHARGETAAVTIRAVAAKWNWRFEYPGGVVEQGTADDRGGTVQPAVLVVPSSEPVRIELTALDVVHAFWIPATNFKFDALPDRTNVFDLRFDPGVRYDKARCSEFCGEYHDRMVFEVRVLAPRDFRAWLQRRRAQGAPA